ncbi:MAG: hypothetical protein Tsb0010_14630 [Parvularculaceae bacterium]
MRPVRLLFATMPALAAPAAPAAAQDAPPIGQALIHPPFTQPYACSEHWEGQLRHRGDALGADCFVTGPVETPDGGRFWSPYRNAGFENEDWFSFGADVLAPFDGEVVRIAINEVENKPGALGQPPATFVIFESDDGVSVLIAHLADLEVATGDRVRAGEAFAKVGNNGFGRNPHIHIGAWRGEEPLQIRHDLRAAGRLHSPDE